MLWICGKRLKHSPGNGPPEHRGDLVLVQVIAGMIGSGYHRTGQQQRQTEHGPTDQ